MFDTRTLVPKPINQTYNDGSLASAALGDSLHNGPAIAGPESEGVLHCGYGRCSQCKCAGFVESIENARICGRCGHSYQAHW